MGKASSSTAPPVSTSLNIDSRLIHFSSIPLSGSPRSSTRGAVDVQQQQYHDAFSISIANRMTKDFWLWSNPNPASRSDHTKTGRKQPPAHRTVEAEIPSALDVSTTISEQLGAPRWVPLMTVSVCGRLLSPLRCCRWQTITKTEPQLQRPANHGPAIGPQLFPQLALYDVAGLGGGCSLESKFEKRWLYSV